MARRLRAAITRTVSLISADKLASVRAQIPGQEIDQEIALFLTPNELRAGRTTPAKKRANYLCPPTTNPKIKMANQAPITYFTPITIRGKETRLTGTSPLSRYQSPFPNLRSPLDVDTLPEPDQI
jgi:hypothetical protein